MQVENKSMKLATKVDSNSSRQYQQCKVSPQWDLKFHLESSLLKSNSANVGVLSPEETSANFFPELGTTLGMIR